MSTESEWCTGYYVDKKKEPERFYALCDENLQKHRLVIQESYDSLIEKGVPEAYIYVINANRDDDERKGDIFAYTNKARLEEAIDYVREHARYCHSPDVFIFICVDVRDHATREQYLDKHYFKEDWFVEMTSHLNI